VGERSGPDLHLLVHVVEVDLREVGREQVLIGVWTVTSGSDPYVLRFVDRIEQCIAYFRVALHRSYGKLGCCPNGVWEGLVPKCCTSAGVIWLGIDDSRYHTIYEISMLLPARFC